MTEHKEPIQLPCPRCKSPRGVHEDANGNHWLLHYTNRHCPENEGPSTRFTGPVDMSAERQAYAAWQQAGCPKPELP